MTETNGDNVVPPDELKSRALDLSREAGRTLGASANEAAGRAMHQAGHKLETLADRVKRTGSEWAEESHGALRPEHVEAAAGKLRNAGSYLERNDPKSAYDDVVAKMRAHPVKTLAVGLCTGWLVGRLMRR
jgi:hypothetical protein